MKLSKVISHRFEASFVADCKHERKTCYLALFGGNSYRREQKKFTLIELPFNERSGREKCWRFYFYFATTECPSKKYGL